MVFKELEIQGFKSFPDKVKITFDAGVTGVVGPNGSGKSNLSDAVRWVLGETSSRQLRAAGKMEDVIFGGTRRRSAMGFASVRLTLDNTGHTLDVDADEVTIGRKYYRSGDSEYTINGQVCRLRDVYELLLDTGIGRDGYSVIGQGRIAEIVAAKSSERREIFEEACGIAKYRYRKTEAERRLAAAGENLERLRDILGELESRVGPLEKESAKAQKFLELSEQRKTLEVTLWTDSVHRARDTVRQQVRDYETAQADYERFDGEAKAAEQEAEEIRMQAQQLTIAVERLNGDIRSITEQISGSDSRIAVLENDILRNEESIASLRSEIEAGEQDGAEADAALQRHRAVAAKMEAEGEKLAAEIDALNAELEQLADASNASGARKDTLRAEITDLTAKRTEAQVAQAAAEAAEETARQRLPALEQAVQEGTDQWETARQDLTDTIRYREMLTENEKQLANVRSGLELKLKNRKAALDEADTAEQRLGRELDAARQRLSVLRELEKKSEEYQQLMDESEALQDELMQEIAAKEKDLKQAKYDEYLAKLALQGENPPSNASWTTPVSGYTITSPFGIRTHPILGTQRMHNGIDMACNQGTPIYATRAGTVTVASYQAGGAGYYVSINHLDGFSSIYMHMTNYVVSAGQSVSQGQLIGYVGSTGLSTGPHLHFGISYAGTYVNPLAYIY